jgi:hypothetical protein
MHSMGTIQSFSKLKKVAYVVTTELQRAHYVLYFNRLL